MKKEDFRNALRDKLTKVPLEVRKTWNDTDLFAWWLKARAEDSYLTWERAHGDIWQYVPGMCRDLTGPDAMR
jgi:hypothetical protein